MTTSAQIALLSRQELEKLSREHIDLKVGDRLRGEVMEVRDDGKAVVDFGKFQAALELKVPVEKGDIISVVVVEKGKQIKLKLEQIESQQRVPAEVQKAVSQAEAQQARAASELKLQVREEPVTHDRIEAPTEKNRADFFKSERQPPDLKEALVKLKQILQASENTDIKSLSGEIKNILETLRSYSEALDPAETVARPAEQLVQNIRSGEIGIPVDKDIRETLTKITDAVDRLVQLKNLDQLPEIKTIIEKELKPNLQQLREIVDREIAKADPAIQHSLEDVKKTVDDLLKNMEKVLGKLPDKVASRQQAPQSPEIDNLVKQLSKLRSMAENSPASPSKETTEIVDKLSEMSEKVSKLSSPERMQEVRTIIENEVKPNLIRLRDTADEELKQAVNDILKAVGKSLERQPEKAEVNVIKPTTTEVREAERMVENIVKQISQLREQVKSSPIPVERETLELLNRLSEAAETMGQLKNPEQLPELKPVIDTLVRPGLLELRRVIDNTPSRAEPVRQRAAVEIKQAVDNTLRTLEKLEKTLEKLPESLKTAEQIDVLLKEIKNIREALEARSETLELGNKIVRQISGIKALVENYRLPSISSNEAPMAVQRGLEGIPPFEWKVEVLVERLSEVAGKIAQIKTPDQLPELKSIIVNELKPDLSTLKEVMDKNVPPPEQVPERVETGNTRDARQEMEARQAAEGIKLRVEYLQREIEYTLTRLPENERWTEETQELLKDIESALDKISKFSYMAGQTAPVEDIEALFENIKIALRQLRVNINTGQQPLELPPELKDIFANLQLNFNSADMEKVVTEQIVQVKSLIEMLENSGFAADKRIEVMMAKLSEIVNKLTEIRSSAAPDKWQQLLQTLQQDLSPALKTLKQVFAPRESVQSEVIRERMAEVFDAVVKLEQQVGRFVEKNTVETKALQEVFAESAGKVGDIPKGAGQIFAGLPRSLQTPENLAQLAENIRNLGPASLPEEIRPFLSMIRSHFEPLDISQNAIKLVPKLKSLVEDSGIFFEKKLQDVIARLSEASDRLGTIDNLNRLPEIRDIIREDLKPNLLHLRELLNDERLSAELGPKEVVEALKKSVENLLENIGSQQGRAAESQVQQQPVMMFSFNLPIEGQEDAQLKVFYNRGKKREEEGEFKLSLLLNMDKLGDIRTDFSQYEKNLNITFFVKSYKIKEYIEDNIDEVREPLELEFKSVNLKVMVSEEQIAAFDPETAVPGIITEKEVDVKV